MYAVQLKPLVHNGLEVIGMQTPNADGLNLAIKKLKGVKWKYAMEFKPDKKGYLFEGAEKGRPYSVRSLQEVLQTSKAKANVIKAGGMHGLRHSFATHLVDRGTDLTMIQKLLGHNDIKTTLRYLRTSNKDLLSVVSPLDDLKID